MHTAAAEAFSDDEASLRVEYLKALIDAALASVHYRSIRRLYEQSLFIGPWTESADGSLVRSGDARWSCSTEEARLTLDRSLRNEALYRYFPNGPRVSSNRAPIVDGEAIGEVASRVAYTQARDKLLNAFQSLAVVSAAIGRDPRQSVLYKTFALYRELDCMLSIPAENNQSLLQVREVETDAKP
ncbi:hypothetical protein [Pseudomonas monteilii]|uniref:hypothetical protein n=1 Tax=Pseudomonas monteilii TaxID=76759 RepID=UPI0015FDBA4B|nr:hypothetical protein [Pseudomonas monteilii]MBA6105274.1 hypothetical protein [Pseudomonas monteilii]